MMEVVRDPAGDWRLQSPMELHASQGFDRRSAIQVVHDVWGWPHEWQWKYNSWSVPKLSATSVLEAALMTSQGDQVFHVAARAVSDSARSCSLEVYATCKGDPRWVHLGKVPLAAGTQSRSRPFFAVFAYPVAAVVDIVCYPHPARFRIHERAVLHSFVAGRSFLRSDVDFPMFTRSFLRGSRCAKS